MVQFFADTPVVVGIEWLIGTGLGVVIIILPFLIALLRSNRKQSDQMCDNQEFMFSVTTGLIMVAEKTGQKDLASMLRNQLKRRLSQQRKDDDAD